MSYAPPSQRVNRGNAQRHYEGDRWEREPSPSDLGPHNGEEGGKGGKYGGKGKGYKGGKGKGGKYNDEDRGDRERFQDRDRDRGDKGGKDGSKGWRGEKGGKGGGKGGDYDDGHAGRGEWDGTKYLWGNRCSEEAPLERLFKNTRHQVGLNFDKYKEIPVEVSGGHCPDPIEDFSDASLHPLLVKNIERYKYKIPTPIQKYTVPIMCAGNDLMACAQTGSGKTAAFLFPIITSLLTRGPQPFRRRIRHGQAAPEVLILAPTRELAVQIFEEAQKFSYQTGLRPVVVYGGVDLKSQIDDLHKGCQIIVATPGRLLDLCTPRKGGKGPKGGVPKLTLSNVCLFCIDEADRMLDLGFEVQIRQIISERDLPPTDQRQTMMLSATFPKSIQKLAQDFLADPYHFIEVGRIGSTNTGITQRLEYCAENEKKEFLLSLLHHSVQKKLCLIFVDTKSRASELVNCLIASGTKATTIHGDRTQPEREAALLSFKRAETPILVATDLASRGLDIPNVSHVIQYDLAHTLDDYVHRIGRTGRAGHVGVATSFFNEKNKGIGKSLVPYLEQHTQEVPRKLKEIVATAGGPTGRANRENRDVRGGPSTIHNAANGMSRRQQMGKDDGAGGSASVMPSYGASSMMMAMMDAGGGAY